MKKLLLFVLLLSSNSIQAYTTKAFIDLDNVIDLIDIGQIDSNDNATITLKTKSNFVMFKAPTSPNQTIGIYSNEKGSFVLDTSCCGSDKELEQHVFKYSQKNKGWFLSKIFSGQMNQNKPEEGHYIYCIEPLSFNKIYQECKEASTEDTALLVNNEINSILNMKKNNKELDIFNALNLSYYIKLKDVESVNNIAYFAIKKNPISSIILLNKVITLDATRVVAYFNLADAYMATGQKDLAIQNYKKYIQLMQEKGLTKKIPKRVLDIVKSK